MDGGGVRGRVVGIAHITMTADGFITAMFQVFILMSTQVGEDIIDTMIGTATGGTMRGFLTNDCNKTGRNGIMTDIGKGKRPGASRAINPVLNNRGRN
jgi:hypothetical protein